MKKYKIGDKVVIRPDLKNKRYPLPSGDGEIKVDKAYLAGTTQTIEEIIPGIIYFIGCDLYRFKDIKTLWTDNLFFPANSIKYYLWRRENENSCR